MGRHPAKPFEVPLMIGIWVIYFWCLTLLQHYYTSHKPNSTDLKVACTDKSVMLESKTAKEFAFVKALNLWLSLRCVTTYCLSLFPLPVYTSLVCRLSCRLYNLVSDRGQLWPAGPPDQIKVWPGDEAKYRCFLYEKGTIVNYILYTTVLHIPVTKQPAHAPLALSLVL